MNEDINTESGNKGNNLSGPRETLVPFVVYFLPQRALRISQRAQRFYYSKYRLNNLICSR
jgi:hypothetical protein